MTGEHNVSGRSSAYGDNAPDSAMPPIGIGVNQAPRSETNTLDVPTPFTVSSVYSIVQVYIADLHTFLKATETVTATGRYSRFDILIYCYIQKSFLFLFIM